MSIFLHYNTTFDPLNIIERYANPNAVATPGFVTNYLGVKIDPKFHPPILEPLVGTLEAIPIPANWHADVSEWGGALRAVDLSGEIFTAVELGCAWGCWLNITGAAARFTGREVALVGVEGDEEYLEFARESLTENAFRPEEIHLHHAIAAASRGTALFPHRDGAAHFGLEPIFDASPEQVTAAKAAGTHDVLATVTLADLTPGDRIDLLHIDIQGGELDFVRSCLDQLHERVAYMLIGTHSRQIEGALFETLLGTGRWFLELERPAIFTLSHEGPVTAIDGVQCWRNLDLLPL